VLATHVGSLGASLDVSEPEPVSVELPVSVGVLLSPPVLVSPPTCESVPPSLVPLELLLLHATASAARMQVVKREVRTMTSVDEMSGDLIKTTRPAKPSAERAHETLEKYVQMRSPSVTSKRRPDHPTESHHALLHRAREPDAIAQPRDERVHRRLRLRIRGGLDDSAELLREVLRQDFRDDLVHVATALCAERRQPIGDLLGKIDGDGAEAGLRFRHELFDGVRG
jgi:hypothetical protein